MSQPIATYDFPWGTRPICPLEHEQSIGGDGFGGRCCGTADVMVVVESDDDCARHFCEEHCQEKCCLCCHADDRWREDAELCASCAQEQAAQQQIDADGDRPRTTDTRTPNDHEMERQQQRRDDDNERDF
jgi:hypothetical protein